MAEMLTTGDPASKSAALDDVSATEWREEPSLHELELPYAALDDVSATEWRLFTDEQDEQVEGLHSMMSVLPNGGRSGGSSACRTRCCTR